MDLTTIDRIRRPADRSELRLDDGEAFLGGGSWLFSEPQLHLSGLVDLTALDWRPIVQTTGGLSIAATCTFAELAAWPLAPQHPASHLFEKCCQALLGSFKVWNVATVGGNICLALAAGPMTSLAAALDAEVVIWMPDGGERRMPAAYFVTGIQRTALEPGELMRSIEIPTSSLEARTGYRRIALSPLGRSGTLVIARHDSDGTFVVTVSAGTEHPVQLRFDRIPDSADLAAAVHGIDCWYTDAHGAPDWREAMSALFAEELRVELSAADRGSAGDGSVGRGSAGAGS